MKKLALFIISILLVISAVLIINKPWIKRPQEPTKPYPYYSEEVTFQNVQAKVTLNGTLTLPSKEGNFSVVILITGSGPQNRDEYIDGHRPFLVISDYLTKRGIAVLRYDYRGYGGPINDYWKATSIDLASDVESAILYLKTRKEINKNKIGLLGHSEGGSIAPIVASKSEDVSFIVLLAGSGIKGDKSLIYQTELTLRASGISEKEIEQQVRIISEICEIVSNSPDVHALRSTLTQHATQTIKEYELKVPGHKLKRPDHMTEEEYILSEVDRLSSPWWVYFIMSDPAIVLEKVTCPVLALNGEKDVQVTPKENLAIIKNALVKGGNMNVTVKELPDLNHLFQECDTGSLNEYHKIRQTI